MCLFVSSTKINLLIYNTIRAKILSHFSVLSSYTTAFTLYHCIALIFYFIPLHYLILHLCYIIAKYGLYSPKFFRPQITNWYPIKIFSPPTHPHSNHFTYKYQNFSYFYFTYMVHKPHTFQVLLKLVYGL